MYVKSSTGRIHCTSAYLPNLAHSHYKYYFDEVGFPSVPSSVVTGHRTQLSLERTCTHCHSGNSTDRNSPHHQERHRRRGRQEHLPLQGWVSLQSNSSFSLSLDSWEGWGAARECGNSPQKEDKDLHTVIAHVQPECCEHVAFSENTLWRQKKELAVWLLSKMSSLLHQTLPFMILSLHVA